MPHLSIDTISYFILLDSELPADRVMANHFAQASLANRQHSPKEIKAMRQQAKLDDGFRHHQEGRYQEAEALYSEVLQETPSNTEALLRLGMLSYDLKFYTHAIDYLKKALRKKDKDARILAKLAQALHKTGETQTALPLINKAIRLQPKFPQFVYDKANFLADLGRKVEAIEHLRGVLRANPRDIGALALFVDIHKFSGDEPEISQIRSLAADPAANSEFKTAIYRALGKIETDLENHQAAIDAVAVSRRTMFDEFDLESFKEANARRKDFYTGAFFSSRNGFGDPTRKPVFIVGMPRSGTTLTEQIIASHPQAFGAGELLEIPNIANMVGAHSDEFVRHYALMRDIAASEIRKLAALYIDYTERVAADISRVTDKLPHNFQNLGLIGLLFPEATIIHCKRNPIDNCVSCFMSPLGEGHGYTRDLATLGSYYREYDALMGHWKSALPNRILEVRYEETVADLETAARRIIAHCRLEWDDRCLEFHKTERTVSTISRDQVRQPVYKSSVNRWKRYGNRLLPLIDALGPLAGEARQQLTDA